MNLERLDLILAQAAQKTILVVGDFFLDKHLIIDQALAEPSPETGLDAHQVVEVRTSPGAAGTVTNNLRALGVEVTAVGVVGDDGEGFDLLRGLDATGVDVDGLVIRADRFTPTYTRPMLRVRGGALRELNRLDIKNRGPLPREAEDRVIRALRGLLPPRSRRDHRGPGAGGRLWGHHRAGAGRVERPGSDLQRGRVRCRFPRAHRIVPRCTDQAERGAKLFAR